MNNMTKKVGKGKTEMRRDRYNRMTSMIGGAFILVGILLLVTKGLSVEYVDASGILHENFFLVPVGFLCIFCGLISFVTLRVKTLIHKFTSKRGID